MRFFALLALLAPFSLRAASPLTVTRSSIGTFYVETSAPASMCAYASYNIYNNSLSDQADVWVSLSNFSNSNLHVSLNDPDLTHVGAIPSHVTKTAFFYLCADAILLTPVTHDLNAYASSVTSGAGSTLLNSTPFSYTSIVDGTETGSTAISSLTISPNPPILGGTVVMTVSGTAGNLSAGGFTSFSPASFVTWPAMSFQLQSTSVTLSNKNTGTYTDQLFINGLANGNSTDYSAVYTFRVVSLTAAAVSANPKAYMDSGTIKETDASSSGFQPVSAPTNTLVLTLLLAQNTVVWNNTDTLTLHVVNSGPNSVKMDGFRVILPLSPAGVSVVAGSSTFPGLGTLPDPADLGNGIRAWDGVFSIPAFGSADLNFALSFPQTASSYLISGKGMVGGLTIDTTLSTTDYQPASDTVTVLLPTPTFSQSPTFTPSPTFSDSPTPTLTPVLSATDSPTLTASPTSTPSVTASPTRTPTPTPSMSPTPFTPSATMTFSPTPATHPNSLVLTLGPVPSKRGKAICLYGNSPLAESEWTLFGADQQVVGRLHFYDPVPCFTRTSELALGVTMVRIKAKDIYGHETTVIKLLLIEP